MAKIQNPKLIILDIFTVPSRKALFGSLNIGI